MRKVCVVVTAQPSYSWIKTALLALQRRPDVELHLTFNRSTCVWR